MPKKKETNPAEDFTNLIRESTLNIEKGMDTFFDDVAKSAERIIGHLDPPKKSEKSEEKKT